MTSPNTSGPRTGAGWAWLLALPVLCCAGPVVLATVSARSLTAALGSRTGTPALLAGAAAVVVVVVRRPKGADPYRAPLAASAATGAPSPLADAAARAGSAVAFPQRPGHGPVAQRAVHRQTVVFEARERDRGPDALYEAWRTPAQVRV